MARKRMFRTDVLDTDAFLDMPLSAQALYFHLNLRADDDGFIGNPKRITSTIGASIDDLKLLIAKRFIIVFDDGVIVIKHWRMHNTIQKDRYSPTKYQEDLALLKIKDNLAYTLSDDGVTLIEQKQNKNELSNARKMRSLAKKESELPYSFENQIRIAFNGEKCPICGCTMTLSDNQCMPTIQHNKPISLGGKHDIDNISVICRSCNSSVQNKCETPPFNTDLVKEKWAVITGMYRERAGNVSTDIDKDLDKDIDKDIDLDISSAQSLSQKAPTPMEEEAPVELIPLSDGSGWRPTLSEYNEYERLFPDVDIDKEFRKMRAWSLSNTKKTKRGIKRFVTGWLSRAQDRPSGKVKGKTGSDSGRDYLMAVAMGEIE